MAEESKDNKKEKGSKLKTVGIIVVIFGFAIIYAYSVATFNVLEVTKNVGELRCPTDSGICDTCLSTGLAGELYCCKYLAQQENSSIINSQCNRLQQVFKEQSGNNTIFYYRILIDKAMKTSGG